MNQLILLATFGAGTRWLTSLTLALHITKCDRENFQPKLPAQQIKKLFDQRSYFDKQDFKIVALNQSKLAQ